MYRGFNDRATWSVVFRVMSTPTVRDAWAAVECEWSIDDAQQFMLYWFPMGTPEMDHVDEDEYHKVDWEEVIHYWNELKYSDGRGDGYSIEYYADNTTMGDLSDEQCDQFRRWAWEQLEMNFPKHMISVTNSPHLPIVETNDHLDEDDILDFVYRLWDRCPWDWN